ncbi:MAG: hypothetical protein D6682_01460 [Zetaproteobacteria bacterium]|nr:MAG: hypothetical protein D6682_01460 [Zetaproteobacteria bacterium]
MGVIMGSVVKRMALGWLSALLTIFPATAGSWMLSQGEVQYGGGITYYTDDSYWDQHSHLISGTCTSHNLYLFQGLQYGYSYYHTLFVETTFALQRCGAVHTTGLGDVRLGIRGRLDVERNGRTWELAAIVPTGYSRTAPRRIGNGRLGVEGGLFFSGQEKGFEEKKRAFVKAGLKARYWFGPPASQLLGYLGGVWRVGSGQSLEGRINGDFSLRDGRPEPISLTNQTQLSDHDRVYLEGKYNHVIMPAWTATFSIGRDVWGRNSGRGTFAALFLSHTWRP